MLSSLGFAPDAAVTAGESFALLREAERENRPYQLIFMDWNLPDRSGVEATQTILHSLDLASPPRIVFVAAFGRDDITVRAERVGAASILYKPVSRSLLLVSLEEALDGKAGVSSLPAPEPEEALRKAADPRISEDPAEGSAVSALAKQGFLSGIRILVVEDNLINQQIAEEILRDAGAEVTVAGNGRSALEKLEDFRTVPFHLVLMDMQMPEMDGAEATRRIRGQARFDDLPVIAMTAHAMIEEQQQCLALGMNDYIAKPIDVNVFFETIARWLPLSRPHPPETPQEEQETGLPAGKEDSGKES
jgi:CheY-like chemotaxis protein